MELGGDEIILCKLLVKIFLLTHANENFAPVSNFTIPVFKEYCERNKYDFIFQTINTTGRFIVWEKIALIIDLYKKIRNDFDWLFYCDADAMIMNHTIRIESFIDNTKDFIATHDINGFNAGVFLLKNSDWALNFMERVWNVDPHHPEMEGRFGETLAEQLAIKHVMKYMPDHERAEHIKIVSQNLFNCYLYNEYSLSYKEGNFKSGDFILHLPGMENHKREEIFNKFKDLIIR